MELTIYSKQLDLKFDIKIGESSKVRDIGQKLLLKFGYPIKTQFSVFNENQLLELENKIEIYSLNKLSKLSIIFTNQIEITLIHKTLGNKKIIIDAWDQFIKIKNMIIKEYGLSQKSEICLRLSNQIYCLDFLIVHEDIHESTNIQWEAYEVLNYEFENTQYQIKIDISDDWNTIAKQIKNTHQINKVIKINQIKTNKKSIDPKEKYYQLKLFSDTIFKVTIPEEIILQIVYIGTIRTINIKQTQTVEDLIKIAKVEHNLQINKQLDIFYQENHLQIDQIIQDLNLIWNSSLELIEQKITTIWVQLRNAKSNQLFAKDINLEQKVITVLMDLQNSNCNKHCTDFNIIINQQQIDQNSSFSELNISNNQLIEYECDSIEITFIIGFKTLKYHAKKSHTLQSLEQEVKNSYLDIIPNNFSIFKNKNFSCTKTIEDMGLKYCNVSYTFLPLGKLDCQVQLDNNKEKIECFEYNTIDMLEQIIANKYSIECKDIQSFYGYLPLNKNEQLRNLYVNERLDIVMQKKQQIEVYLTNLDTNEQHIIKINIDDPIKVALEQVGLTNIKNMSFQNQKINLTSNCQQLQITHHSTLFYTLFS